jgi:MYXO-CTERM domain-containing protein
MRRLTLCTAASAAILVSATAFAGESNIVGGQTASTCDFPTTIALYNGSGLCTGTLVHPQVVLYASHCGTNFSTIRFTESLGGQERTASVDHCRRFSQAAQVGPSDYAYCKLATPVTEVPATPVAYGCEVTEYIKQGQPASIAGFGDNGAGGAGTKRWAQTTISGFESDMVYVGGGGTGAWQGDSGGPAYVQLADGSWRAFGIVSGGSGPGQPVLYVRMETVVSWVEQQSGVDITPCHDVDGTWNPTPACGGFATTPTGGGSWSNWCADNDPLSEPSESCGDSYLPDVVAPVVTIVTPLDGDVFELEPADVVVDVTVADDSSIDRAWLELDGAELAQDTQAPYSFQGQFPGGEYEVVAFAQDSRDNVGQSEPIVFYVGEPPEDAGCGCRAGGSRSAGGGLALLIAAAALGLVRRRTRRASP